MSPEKIPTRTRLALAQKLRRRSRLPASRDTSPSLDVVLRFTRGWSQEVLAELAGSRSRLPDFRDISTVASGSCPLATLLLPCRASVHVMHRTYISQIERGQVSVDNLEKLANAFELPVPELLMPPSPADLDAHLKDLGIEEPRAHYGPVALGVMH